MYLCAVPNKHVGKVFFNKLNKRVGEESDRINGKDVREVKHCFDWKI